MLRQTRDMKAAKAFFRSARVTMGVRFERVTTNDHDSCPGVIRIVLGKTIWHRTSTYPDNRLEQE